LGIIQETSTRHLSLKIPFSISNIEFKGAGLLYLDTEKGHYYIAVASLIKAGRKIE
jgi:hypothetical protein